MTLHEQEIYYKIRESVTNKNLIRFWYEDTSTNFKDYRIVEPHLVGINTTGNAVLQAWFSPTPYQRSLGHEAGWKIYLLEVIDITMLELKRETYRLTRDGYNHDGGNRIKEVLVATARVSF